MASNNVSKFPEAATGTRAQSNVLGKLTSRDWQKLFERGEHLTLRHDEVILTEGEISNSIFLIAEGEVRVERTLGTEAIELARLSTGAIFGEMSLLDKAEVSASVTASGQVELIRLESAVVELLIGEDSDFGLRFYHSLAVTLSRRLRATNRIVQGAAGLVIETRTRKKTENTGDPVKEALDLSPAVGDLFGFIREATDANSPGGIKFSEEEKHTYRSLRAKMDAELAEVDAAVENNQYLPFAAY